MLVCWYVVIICYYILTLHASTATSLNPGTGVLVGIIFESEGHLQGKAPSQSGILVSKHGRHRILRSCLRQMSAANVDPSRFISSYPSSKTAMSSFSVPWIFSTNTSSTSSEHGTATWSLRFLNFEDIRRPSMAPYISTVGLWPACHTSCRQDCKPHLPPAPSQQRTSSVTMPRSELRRIVGPKAIDLSAKQSNSER